VFTIKLFTCSYFQIKASLRSVLTEDDEEIEVVPHVRGSLDFEVYESVVIKPRDVIMPWDENLKPTYNIYFSVSASEVITVL